MASPLRFWAISLGCVSLTIAVAGCGEATPESAPSAAADTAGTAEPAASEARSAAAARPAAEEAEPPAPLENPGPGEDEPEYSDGSSGLSGEEVADRIRSTRPAVVFFFATPCGSCSQMLPQFVAELEEFGNGIEVLAYALPGSDPLEVDAVLQAHEATFSAEVLREEPSGEFSKAMKEVGIVVGGRVRGPLFAVIGGDGEVILQWSGGLDRSGLRKALRLATS